MLFFLLFCEVLSFTKKVRLHGRFTGPVTEFKEFERRFKYGWFHLKCFKIQAGAKFKPGFGRFKPRLKFFKFHLRLDPKDL